MSKRDISAQLAAALTALLRRDMNNTCIHENTHRGGVIWEICDDCGVKWADDNGGKPEWKNPPEWDAADAALTAYETYENMTMNQDKEEGVKWRPEPNKPWWMFWHPYSGFPGGAVAGLIVVVVLIYFGYIPF